MVSHIKIKKAFCFLLLRGRFISLTNKLHHLVDHVKQLSLVNRQKFKTVSNFTY